MVELIIVIVLVGIVSAVAMTRFFDRTTFDTGTAAEQLRAALRHAQKTAIAQNRPVFVQLAANRVALCFQAAEPCAAANQVLAPGGENSGSAATRAACANPGWMCEGRPAGIAFATNATVIGFDALGQPFGAQAAASFGGLTVTITGGGITRSVGVTPETGHVF